MADGQELGRAVSTASALARALDHNDFAAAESLLAPDCLYESPGGVLETPAAIIAAYRKNAEWAARTFDQVGYASEAMPEGVASARITYGDRITHRGHTHEYRCRQIVETNEDGLIVRIRHEAISGENAALQEYLDRVGVKRDS